jgi:hypothetical protein
MSELDKERLHIEENMLADVNFAKWPEATTMISSAAYYTQGTFLSASGYFPITNGPVIKYEPHDVGTMHWCKNCGSHMLVDKVKFMGNEVAAKLVCVSNAKHPKTFLESYNGGSTWSFCYNYQDMPFTSGKKF